MLESASNKGPQHQKELAQEAMKERIIFEPGDLVRVENEEWVSPETPKQTGRFLLMEWDKDSDETVAWIGPAELSPREVMDFIHAHATGGQHQEKYAGFYTVNPRLIIKLPDA